MRNWGKFFRGSEYGSKEEANFLSKPDQALDADGFRSKGDISFVGEQPAPFEGMKMNYDAAAERKQRQIEQYKAAKEDEIQDEFDSKLIEDEVKKSKEVVFGAVKRDDIVDNDRNRIPTGKGGESISPRDFDGARKISNEYHRITKKPPSPESETI